MHMQNYIFLAATVYRGLLRKPLMLSDVRRCLLLLLSVTHFWKLSRNARVFWLGYDMTIVSGLAYDLFGGQKVNWFGR